MARKISGVLLKRNRYLTGASGVEKRYYPADREKLTSLAGHAGLLSDGWGDRGQR